MEVNTNPIFQSYADPELCRELVRSIKEHLQGRLRFMEVCGTHTMSIYHTGLRSLLPGEVVHLSGPGCPVCVTHAREVAACLHLAARPEVIVATFGDMMRVPGPDGRSLKAAKAQGAKVQICYSPFDALHLARNNPQRQVVFLGVGFETTAPAVAATLQQALALGVDNLSLLSCHKRVPPALRHLLQGGEVDVDAFLLPGHVSTVIGVDPYRFLSREFGLPAVVAGFEPVDILLALDMLVRQQAAGEAEVVNAYPRAVRDGGNSKAQAVLDEVFVEQTASWRGLGEIENSGLALAPEYAAFDAWSRFDLTGVEGEDPPGCRCGQVLKGSLTPKQCALFGRTCTPSHPVGPCMVSTEGSCAAVFKYGLE